MKKKLLAVLISAACACAAIPGHMVLADSQKVVTLGADLSEDQKNAILRYFGVAGQNIQTLTITNTDERNHLGSYVPLEQIGTHTYSCAYVNPTNSGGIQVKTANLTWVTSNMIASTLSTSGVVNCEVLAACPFEVSGTGALTGILMAYETAVDASLDPVKKEVATQELVTTSTVANNIGQVPATEIVNESKMQVIQGNVIDKNEITVIVEEVAKEEEISLSEEDRDLIVTLLEEISQQDYNYEDMRETLERVETNLDTLSESQKQPAEVIVNVDNQVNVENNNNSSSDTTVSNDNSSSSNSSSDNTVNNDNSSNSSSDADSSADADNTNQASETLSQDSILMNTDDSALGESAVFDATNESALQESASPETGAPVQETEAPAAENTNDGFDITTSDSYGDDSQGEVSEPAADEELPAEPSVDSSDNDYGFDITVSDENNSQDAAGDNTPAEDGAVDMTEAPAEDGTSDMTEAPAEDGAVDIAEAPAEDGAVDIAEAPAEDGTADMTEAPAENGTSDVTEAPTGLTADKLMQYGTGAELYLDTLNQYLTLFREQWSMDDIINNNLSMLFGSNASAAADYGFNFQDLNGDGIMELLVGAVSDGASRGMIYDIYTLENDQPKLVASSGERDCFYLYEGNVLANERSSSAACSETLFDTMTAEAQDNGSYLATAEGVRYDAETDPENPYFYIAGEESIPSTQEECESVVGAYTFKAIDYVPFTEIMQ